MQRVGVMLKSVTYEELRRIAFEMRIPMSDIIRAATERYLEDLKAGKTELGAPK